MTLRNNHQRLPTHYAIEILESEGNDQPTQEEINKLEGALQVASNKINIYEAILPLTNSSQYSAIGNALIVEQETLCAAAHTKLFQNIGFSVDIVRIPTTVFQYSAYHIILLNDDFFQNQEKKILRFIEKLSCQKPQPLIILLTNNDSNLWDKYLQCTVKCVLKKPLIYRELCSVIKNFFPIQKPISNTEIIRKKENCIN